MFGWYGLTLLDYVVVGVGTIAPSGRTINDTGAFSVQKIQQLAPTLQVYSSNPRNTAVNIRGIGVPFGLTNDGTEQGVGIYVDDVYFSRVAAATFDSTVLKSSGRPRSQVMTSCSARR